MIIKKILAFFFSEWWRPLILTGVGFFLFAAGGMTKSIALQEFCSWFFGTTLLLLIVSFIYQVIKKKKNPAIFTALSFAGLLIAIFLYGILLFIVDTIEPRDGWADNLTIPGNISLEIPKGDGIKSVRPDSILKIKRAKQDFELYNSFQPGLYYYDVWLGKIEKGTIYLKAYEVTKNYALSTDNLSERSSIEVYNPADSIVRFQLIREFTIYEGDWGKPYAAHFEVWFKPDGQGSKRKLLEKNYKIEGWMR